MKTIDNQQHINRKQITYDKWADHFQKSIEDVLTKINFFDKQLSDNEISLLSLFSTNALEISNELPQDLVLKYKAKNPTVVIYKLQNDNNSSKNILFVTSIFPGLGHGGGLRIFDIMHELNDLGYNVTLFTPEPPADEKQSIKHLKKIVSHMEIVKLQDFHSATYCNWLKKMSKNFSGAYYVWPYHAQMILQKDNFLKNQVFEFIEVTTRRTWMDLVAYIKNSEFQKIPEKILEFWMSYNFEKIAVENCNHLVCVTRKDAEFVENIFDAKISKIIPMGISKFAVLNEIEKVKNIQPIPKSVGFLGNYQHYPNKDGIIWYIENVHNFVLQEIPDYQFYVVGKGNLDDLKERYSHFKKSIKWIGEVKNVVEWMQKLEVCTAPLISGAGIRVKITQYAALQKPIVSTEIGACGMPFKNKHDILIENDPRKFAKSIVRLLQDPSYRKKISANSKKTVQQNFYWKPFIDELSQIL